MTTPSHRWFFNFKRPEDLRELQEDWGNEIISCMETRISFRIRFILEKMEGTIMMTHKERMLKAARGDMGE